MWGLGFRATLRTDRVSRNVCLVNNCQQLGSVFECLSREKHESDAEGNYTNYTGWVVLFRTYRNPKL